MKLNEVLDRLLRPAHSEGENGERSAEPPESNASRHAQRIIDSVGHRSAAIETPVTKTRPPAGTVKDATTTIEPDPDVTEIEETARVPDSERRSKTASDVAHPPVDSVLPDWIWGSDERSDRPDEPLSTSGEHERPPAQAEPVPVNPEPSLPRLPLAPVAAPVAPGIVELPTASTRAELERRTADADDAQQKTEPGQVPAARRSASLETAAAAAESLNLGFHLASGVERIFTAAGQGSDGVPALREAVWLIERYIALLEHRPLDADLQFSAATIARTGDAVAELGQGHGRVSREDSVDH